MNWDRARNYTIFFLILFNLIMLMLNIWTKNSHKLTSSQKQDITSLLRQNGITLSCEIPDDRLTASQLVLKRLDFDYLKLQKIFFKNANNLKRIDASDKVTISNDLEALTIEGNHIEYKCASAAVSDKKQAEKLAKDTVKAIQGYFGSFRQYAAIENDTEYTFRYCESSAGLKIYNNIISISIYKTGGMRVGLSYLQPAEHSGGKLAAISCDEALFSVMPYILSYEDTDKEITITNVEPCYYLHQTPSDEGIAIPCYRIAVNWDKIYYINGYTGELVN